MATPAPAPENDDRPAVTMEPASTYFFVTMPSRGGDDGRVAELGSGVLERGLGALDLGVGLDDVCLAYLVLKGPGDGRLKRGLGLLHRGLCRREFLPLDLVLNAVGPRAVVFGRSLINPSLRGAEVLVGFVLYRIELLACRVELRLRHAVFLLSGIDLALGYISFAEKLGKSIEVFLGRVVAGFSLVEAGLRGRELLRHQGALRLCERRLRRRKVGLGLRYGCGGEQRLNARLFLCLLELGARGREGVLGGFDRCTALSPLHLELPARLIDFRDRRGQIGLALLERGQSVRRVNSGYHLAGLDLVTLVHFHLHHLPTDV